MNSNQDIAFIWWKKWWTLTMRNLEVIWHQLWLI